MTRFGCAFLLKLFLMLQRLLSNNGDMLIDCSVQWSMWKLNAKKLTIRYAERKIRPAEISYKLWCLHCIIWQWFSKSRRQEKMTNLHIVHPLCKVQKWLHF